MNELFERVGNKLPSTKKAVSTGDAYDWFGHFTLSGIESMGELVGIKPDGATEEWRQQNPLASFLSEVAGTAVPYAGWFAATKKIKAFDKVIEGLGDSTKMPFLTGAVREAARFAPFEAGRVIASQFVGTEPLDKMAGSAAVNLAVGAGLGGLFGAVGSAGTRAFPLAKLAPGIDISAPSQIQQRFIQDLLDKGSPLPENIPRLQYKLSELRGFSRGESLPIGYKYVSAVENQPTPTFADNLNRLFKTDNPKSGFVRRKFVAGVDNFKREDEWQAMAQYAGLPKNFEDKGQYFRHVSFKGSRAGLTSGAYDALLGRMDSLGSGWFMKREADDGLFVMARKIEGTPGKPHPSDQWVVFKTDQPAQFVPQRQEWANIVIGKNAWVPTSQIAKDGGVVYNSLTSFMSKFPFLNYRVLLEDPKGVGAAIDKLMPKALRGKSNELVERMRDATKEYLAPAHFQFTKSPRANWLHTAARAVYDAAESEGQRLLYGNVKLDPKKNVFWSALRGQQQPGEATQTAIKTILDSLSDKEIGELHSVWRAAADLGEADAMHAAGKISEATLNAAHKLDEINTDLWTNLNKTQKAVGQGQTKAVGGHYGLSHVWEGDTRIALRGDDGEVVAIASGFNRRGAQASAQKLQQALLEEGKRTRIAEEFQVSQVDKIPLDLKLVVQKPGFLEGSSNIRGFKWDLEPFTRQELMEGLESGVRGRLRYMANSSVADLFLRDLDKLGMEDPVAYRLLVGRLNDLAGVQGPLGMIQNQIVDKVMAPVLGNNSASKIAQIANTTMWHLQLGAGKLAYPIVNALTFLQTVVPEVAYVMSAAPERMAGKYTYFAVGGTRGPVGAMGALNPLRMMVDSVKEMRKPGAGLMNAFERAVNDRVVDPRLVEDYIGESATKLGDLRSAAKSPGNFANWLKAASEFLPAQSERLSRAHAFTVGHILARDYLNIKDPDLAYRFARQFTENTMYLYTTADRPRLFTTPAGSMFGLFKNWMANYTASMMEYMGEGLAHNNWSPILWQTAGTFVVGGFAATPLYYVADGFSKAFTGNSLLESTYNAFNGNQQWAGDGIMFGLPAVVSGGHVSLYSQASSPISNPMRDASMLFSTAHLDRLQYFMKAMGDGWDHWQATGEHPGKDPRFLQEIARAVAPTTLYRTIGAAQDGMINSLSSGYPILKDVGLMDRLFYMAGFNSVDMDKGYAVAEQLFNDKRAHMEQISRLGEAYAEYQMARDSNGMMWVLKQAYASGVDASSVLRSSQARVAKMTSPLLERSFKPEDLSRFSLTLGGSDDAP